MSALGTRNGGPQPTEQVISPTLVESGMEDRSYVDSVVEMISDVVPVGVGVNTGSAGRKGYRTHEHVNWVKMVHTDVLDDSETLVIGMGYGDGIQLFALPTNGVARVILSRRNSSPVKDYCLLPAPPKETKCELSFRELAGKTDIYTLERPLVAICELNTISILAVHSGAFRHSLNHNAQKVIASRNALVAACPMQISVFGAHDFNLLFVLPTAGQVPTAISCRWIAYAEKSLSPTYATPGGLLGDDPTSVTVTVMQAAKSIKTGLTRLGETVTGSCSPPRRNPTSFSQGIVSVVDVLATDTDRRLLHFQAHRDTIAAMCFDPAGNLLLTADKQGRRFHVFRLLPHPGGSAHAKVDHLYVLHRGDTTAAVWDMAFSLDSRWVSVCTARGTVHVFPVAPYGGKASVRTHLSSRVVNKLSRYQRSAGVDQDHDMPQLVNPAAQIRHSLANGDCDAGSRKGDGMLLSMGFSSARACWLNNSKVPTHAPNQDSLFTVTTAGILVEYMLELRPQVHDGAGARPSDHELGVEASANLVAHWQLLAPNATASTQVNSSQQVCMAPNRRPTECTAAQTGCWMSQVEIVTYAAPHRRLWMGPQFSFRPGHLQQGTVLVIHDAAVDGGLVEVESSNELIAEHIAEAMNEQSAVTVHSSADSLYHSPSQSSEHLLIFDADLDSL